jgi:rsbT co-antagonist protein RsbR
MIRSSAILRTYPGDGAGERVTKTALRPSATAVAQTGFREIGCTFCQQACNRRERTVSDENGGPVGQALTQAEAGILDSWMTLQLAADSLRPDLMQEEELLTQSRRFLRLLVAAANADASTTAGAAWDDVRGMLADVSRTRAHRGFTPGETAMFVLSLKQPVAEALGTHAAETWNVSTLLDELGVYTTEVYLASREAVIRRQSDELLELSTPVMRVWDGVLVLPLIGTLDSARAQVVMESLLQELVRTGSTTGIIDITGVPMVDTLVAQHLLKTVAAARLMGADCMISGIRPQIAQTIVHLGLDLGTVETKATLADALAVALRRRGLAVVSLDDR